MWVSCRIKQPIAGRRRTVLACVRLPVSPVWADARGLVDPQGRGRRAFPAQRPWPSSTSPQSHQFASGKHGPYFKAEWRPRIEARGDANVRNVKLTGMLSG